MGLISHLITKGVTTATRNATIRAVGEATADVITATSIKHSTKEDVVYKNGTLLIKPTRSSEEYEEEYVVDIVQELLGIGFQSVTIRPVYRLSEWSRKKYGNIVSIKINGSDAFLGVKKVPSTSYILIEYLEFKKGINPYVYDSVQRIIPGTIYSASDMFEKPHIENTLPQIASSSSTVNEDVAYKNGTLLIEPTRSSEEYIDEYVVDIVQELLAIGFQSVTIRPVYKLFEWSSKKYGSTVSIKINGNDDFYKNNKVPSTSYILIEYLEFKKDINPYIYNNVQRIIPGTKYSATDIFDQTHNKNMLHPNVSSNYTVNNHTEPTTICEKKFCTYCGTPVPHTGAIFCISCGNKL